MSRDRAGTGAFPLSQEGELQGKDWTLLIMSVLISPTPSPVPKGAGSSERANPELEVTQTIEWGVGSLSSLRKRYSGWTAQNEWTCLQIRVTLDKAVSLSGPQWMGWTAQSSLGWGKGKETVDTGL